VLCNIDLQALSSEVACNPQPIETREPMPPIFVQGPDYKMLVIGLLLGALIALLYKNKSGR